MTVIIGGGAAFLAGRSLASSWRPLWMAGRLHDPARIGLRFFHYALFDGELLSLHYFITDTLVLIAGAFLGYRLTLTRQMVSQYPWLYERTDPLGWKQRQQGEPENVAGVRPFPIACLSA